MAPLLKGIILGLAFAILIGPALFALLQTSIHRGFRSGVLLAIGIFLSDLSVLFLCYFGVYQLLGEDPRENLSFGVIGGIILIIFGTVTFTRKTQIEEDSENGIKIKKPGPAIFLLKGFFLNIANPGVWFIWITVMVSISSDFGTDIHEIALFVIGVLATILGTDILKCFIDSKIKSSLNPKNIKKMNHIVGIFLVGFGIYLIANTFFDLKSMIPFYSA